MSYISICPPRHILALFAAACIFAPALAETQWRPERPITMVVPYSPGGGTDTLARAVAKQMQTLWGQPVIVENAPGADGLIGTRKVIDAKPDGYTLLMQVPSLVLIRHNPAFKGVDPVTQLDPVSAVAQAPSVVVANSKLPGQSMAEVVRQCKAAAQPCSVGTTENLARVLAKMLETEGDIKNMITVNYKGGGQLIADLVGNNVNMAFMGLSAAMPHQKSGVLKVLASMGDKRSSALPDVPTTAEAGFPDFKAVTWYGVFAPKGISHAVQEALAAAVREAIKDDGVLRTLGTLGAEGLGSTPAEFGLQVRQESGRMERLVQRFPVD